MPAQPEAAHGLDSFLFGHDAHIAAETHALSMQMNTLNDSLSDLRDMLSFMSKPFPVQAMTQMPCAIVHHDADLFDGEPLAIPPQQDTTIGGETDFLFGDASSYEDHGAQHAA